jgi:hypothetical protein
MIATIATRTAILGGWLPCGAAGRLRGDLFGPAWPLSPVIDEHPRRSSMHRGLGRWRDCGSTSAPSARFDGARQLIALK